ARGEDDDRQLLAAAPHLGEHLHAVLPGQPEVEHDEVEVLVPGARRGEVPVVDGHRREPARPQPLREEGRDPRLVLDDEDPRHVVTSTVRSSVSPPEPGPGACGAVPSSWVTTTPGSTISKWLPPASPGRSSTRPPCDSAIALTIDRPSPA